ncbi:hypothetical protein PF010_g19017 [Phytophthora fragariae]|uniref:Uncharacterized protein n=2 Tax=Phytophthora TaxID=4783 RepID=A0A6A4CUB7_9STRA|nr:hypothetical protein PF011_g18784 [Phytophthora fragariae]KAE9089376.1 hypothetical protein PF010_g19017 [Phytophthora fragariae]KAE9091262.1 hypothetical protein PF007_g18948 [Phytophthora fragariae]KAE9201588.1 hypothetical protein PF004_g18674 [Phytophthora fragariae]KAE9202885.1 hypothetical protein PF002_g21107 [Phytophthora fragariae]
MAPSKNIEVKGTVMFAQHAHIDLTSSTRRSPRLLELTAKPTPFYRYKINLQDEKLVIWVENQTTKLQWSTGQLNKCDYVTTMNTIHQFSIEDYVELFEDTLNCELSDTSSTQRSLSEIDNGALKLELSANIRFPRSTSVVKYVFVLAPVKVDRIDVLESKLLDQEEVTKQIKERNDAAPAFIQLKAEMKDDNSNLIWEEIDADDFVSDGEDGIVQFRRPGVYNIGGVVNTAACGREENFELLINGEIVQTYYPASLGQRYSSTTLCYIARLEEDDELTIAADCALYDTSHLSVMRLGS